ncbi:MAG: V-type ATP synthase subunit E [Ruminococcus sp.]|nr:V-type ATP synthase subunit E [Ruminococcus sp.]
MTGLDSILDIIETHQKQTENNIILSAENRARTIEADDDLKAEKVYSEYMKKALEKAENDYQNACNSVDAENRRKILKCRVGLIETATKKVLEKLSGLPDAEYFEMILRLAGRKIHKGDGIIYFGQKDLARLPADFNKKISLLANRAGGTVSISAVAADIENGFILEYGLISENCTFDAILESEKDTVCDIIARELSGR